MFHPCFYNFVMFWSCGGEVWRRLYSPGEEMVCAAVLPGLAHDDSSPKDCVADNENSGSASAPTKYMSSDLPAMAKGSPR